MKDTEWARQAACAGLDTEIFFSRTSQPGGASEAKRVCWSCPVRAACLEYALDPAHTVRIVGIWGGTTPHERRLIQRARAAGRRSAP